MWDPPADTSTAGSPRTTRTGSPLDSVVPSPSWPESLAPQHHTSPTLVSAHVCVPPVDTEVTGASMPTTASGLVFAQLTIPNPNCPEPFDPQHATFPSAPTRHAWSPPTSIVTGTRTTGPGEGVDGDVGAVTSGPDTPWAAIRIASTAAATPPTATLDLRRRTGALVGRRPWCPGRPRSGSTFEAEPQ